MEDDCQVKRCRSQSSMIYSAGKAHKKRPVCDKHFGMHCTGEINLKAKSTYKK